MPVFLKDVYASGFPKILFGVYACAGVRKFGR